MDKLSQKSNTNWLRICLSIVLIMLLLSSVSFAETQSSVKATTSTSAKTISMDFRDVEIDQVLKAYSIASGLTVVKDPAVKGPVTIICATKLNLDEAFDVLSSMLAVRGYVVKKSDKLLMVSPVFRSSTPGVSGTPEGMIAEDGVIVTQVIPLKRANAIELKSELQPMLTENASIMASAQTNSLIVTDFAPKVQQLALVIDELDKAPTQSGAGGANGSANSGNANNRQQQRRTADGAFTEVIYVRYANASDLARTLTQLFTTQGNGRNGNNSDLPFEMRITGGGGGNNAASGGTLTVAPMLSGQGNTDAASSQGTGASMLSQFMGAFAGGQMTPEQAQRLAETGAQMVRQQMAAQASASTTIPTRIVADTYSNSLIVSGSSESIAAIKAIVASVDQGQAASITQLYKVRYGKAVDLANMVNQLYGVNQTYRSATSSVLSSTGTTNQNRTTTQATQTNQNANRTQQQTAQNTQNRNNNTNNNNTNRNALQALLGATAGGQAWLNRTGVGSSSATSGRPRISNDFKVIPDEPTNSIVLQGPKEIVDEIQDLLKLLDVAPPQVNIEALIVEVALDDGNKLGISWGALAGNNPDTSELNWGLTNGNLDPLSGLKYTVITSGIKAVLDTIKSNSKFKVLSTPSIMTINNSQASMYVGKQVPYLASTTTDSNGNTRNAYEYRNVGVTLQVFPRITESGMISLDIYQNSSEVMANATPGAPPSFSSRDARTSVMVKHSETVVIGGIIREDKTETVKKIPILGSIPVLGALFTRKEETTSKSELLVFITPQIVRTASDLGALTTDRTGKLSKEMQDTIVVSRPVPTLSQNDIEETLLQTIEQEKKDKEAAEARQKEAQTRRTTTTGTVSGAPPAPSGDMTVNPTPNTDATVKSSDSPEGSEASAGDKAVTSSEAPSGSTPQTPTKRDRQTTKPPNK